MERRHVDGDVCPGVRLIRSAAAGGGSSQLAGFLSTPGGLYLSTDDMVLHKVVLIALAGGLGALARYWLSGMVLRVTGAGLPYGTLAVNVLGCFLFGLVWAIAAERMMVSPETRTIILVGFLGSFTTLSTFIFESHSLLADARWLLALGNLAVMNIAGLGVFALGLAIGRAV